MNPIRITAASLLFMSADALAGYENDDHYHDRSYYGYVYVSGSLQAANDSSNPNDSIGCTVSASQGSRFVLCTSYKGDDVASCYSTDPYIIDAASSVNPASHISFGVWPGVSSCESVSIRNSSESLLTPRELEESTASIIDVIYSETDWLASLISYYGGW